jgi:aspartyl-tRNA(Asn)/glutamyl-tRNA(Gln) amidotransferase subunit C
MKIARDEIIKIAEMSKLEVREEEVYELIEHLQSVLTYAERVCQVAEDTDEPSNKNINVMRDDRAYQFDATPLLKQAVDEDDRFFIVPKIL